MTSVEFPEDLWRAVKDRALDEQTSLRAVLIAALDLYLKTKPKKKGASNAR